MRKKFTAGFTLIELLVVIAIISLLSSVVLAALNGARDKAADSTVKANLDTVRKQAELYYGDNNGSYANVCSDPVISKAFFSAAAAKGFSTWTPAGNLNNQAVCYSTAIVWTAYVRTSAGNYWCVDHKGTVKNSTVNMGLVLGAGCQ